MKNRVFALLAAVSFAGVVPAAAKTEMIVSGGSFVGENEEIKPGWYVIEPAGNEYTKASIFDCKSFDEPVLVAEYAWWESGEALLQDVPEEYVIPLWEGCVVIDGYHSEMEYISDGEVRWNQYEEVGSIRLAYKAPLDFPSAEEQQGEANEESPRLLYEDENLSASYSDVRVEKVGDSSYLKIELLFENKTDRILNVGCDTIIINGCAVHVSKFVEIPSKSKYLHEWTISADMYLKYGITQKETFSMVFEYHNANTSIAGKTMQSKEIEIK